MEKFNEYWDLIPKETDSEEVGKELLCYAKNISERDVHSSLLSAECLLFLRRNLHDNPYPTFQLLNLLFTNRHASKNDILEELCFNTLYDMCTNLNSQYSINKFFNLFSNIKLSEKYMNQIIDKIFPIVAKKRKKKIIVNSDLYLCLLSRNNKYIITKYLQYEEKNMLTESITLKSLMLKTIKLKQHWFCDLIEADNIDTIYSDNELRQYLYVFRLIRASNASEEINIGYWLKKLELLPQINLSSLNKIYYMYCMELCRQRNLLTFMQNNTNITENINIGLLSKSINILGILQNCIEFNDTNYDKLKKILTDNESSIEVLLRTATENNVSVNIGNEFGNSESEILDKYIIMNLYLNLILFKPERELNMARIKMIIKNMNLLSFLDIIEIIFSLLFLRYEHLCISSKDDINKNNFPMHHSLDDKLLKLKTKKEISSVPDKNADKKEMLASMTKKSSGFICDRKTTEKILNSLKFIITQKKHSAFQNILDLQLKERFVKISEHVNDALWRLSLFPETKFANKSSSSLLDVKINYNSILISQHDEHGKATSSDEDNNNNDSLEKSRKIYKTFPRRKRRKKILKSKSDNSNQTSSESDKLRDIVTSTDYSLSTIISDLTQKNVIVKMLGSPESLIIFCMDGEDFSIVHTIIKNFKLENTLISEEIDFIQKYINVKMKLKSILVNYENENINTSDKSTIEKIKTMAAVGFETSKIMNIIETFTTNNKLIQPANITNLIEKYSTIYSYLKYYQAEHLQIIIIIDLMISLKNNYDLNLSISNMIIRKYLINDYQSTPIGYMNFLKNILDAIFHYKNILHYDMTIEKLLNTQFYSLKSSILEDKLNKLKLFDNLLQNVKDSEIQNIGELAGVVKQTEGVKFNFNYFQRIIVYLENIKKLMNYYQNLEYQQLEKPSDILQLNIERIIGMIIFEQNIEPQVIESIVTNLNINFIYTIIGDCNDKIFINYNNTATDTINNELPTLNVDETKKFKLNLLTLEYIKKSSCLISFLLQEIHQIEVEVSNSVEGPINVNCDIFSKNCLSLPEITALSTVFNESRATTFLNYDFIDNRRLIQLVETSTDYVEVFNIIDNINEKQYKNMKFYFDELKDSILKKIINSSSSNYTYLEKILNIQLKTDLFLQSILIINSFDYVKNLLQNILLSKKCNELSESIKNVLQQWLKKLHIYHEISEEMNRLKNESTTWITMYHFSVDTQERILHFLLEHRLFEICLQWIEIHPLCENKNKFKEFFDCFTIALSQDQNEINHLLLTIIETLPQPQVFEFYDIIIMEMKNLKLLNYIILYLIKNTSLPNVKYQKYLMTIKIFDILSKTSEKFDNLWNLISRPLLIIEQYLMNSKFDVLSKIINETRIFLKDQECKICCENRSSNLEIKTHLLSITTGSNTSNDYIIINIDTSHTNVYITHECIDSLLRLYAAKALDFRVIENHSSATDVSQSAELTSIDSLYANGAFIMPKVIPSKNEWIRDDEVTICMCCRRSVFTMLTRRHHCRRCGRVICHACSTKRMKIIELYSEVLVRVCNDCYKQTEQVATNQSTQNDISSEERIKIDSIEVIENIWHLSGNLKHDNLVRDEFSYEYAPSVSLCLSICALHSPNIECAQFLLYNCRNFENILRPLQPGYSNPEIDYILVTKMLHCLALAAKVRGGASECNTVMDHADIILSIVQSGCEHLLPMETLNSCSLRKLIDSLVLAEKWNLSLDLSLKCGFSSKGIMAAWGIASLKAGCYDTAREKFTHCMSKISNDRDNSILLSIIESESLDDINEMNRNIIMIKRPSKSPPLLIEIINILRMHSYPQKEEVMIRVNKIKDSNTSLSSNTKLGKENLPLHEPALNILHTLNNLKQITRGSYSDILETNMRFGSNVSDDFLCRNIITDSRYFEESMYYLTTYGSHTDILEFLVKHKQIMSSLKYILLQNVEPDIFIQTLFIPYMKNGNVGIIISLMMEIDDTLITWSNYIKHTCRYLEIKKLLNSLYHLQILLKDPIRASMTCVKFYSMNCKTFTELRNNRIHLLNAQKHLQSELELSNWEEIKVVDLTASKMEDASKKQEKSLLMKMNLKTINSHINTIFRQLEVTKFLSDCEISGRETIHLLPKMFIETSTAQIPTLFGSTQEKIQLAILTLICGKNIEEGFGLSFRIIQDFNLSMSKVYGATAKYLTSNNRIIDIEKLIECIKSNNAGDDDMHNNYCDEIICVSVQTAVSTYGPQIKSTLDNLIRFVCDIGLKISCHIQSGQLKSAYLLAVQHNRLNDVRKVLRQAETTNQIHVKRLCEKKLNLSPNQNDT